MYAPNMYPRQMPNRLRVYKRPQQPVQKQGQQQNIQKPIQNTVPNNNVSNNNDEPSLDYLKSLGSIDLQKDYLGEYLFKKIEQHPIAQNKNLSVDVISKITGMILGIEDIKEIYDITVNNENITARINEALSLLKSE
jgi:competence protein ComGC